MLCSYPLLLVDYPEISVRIRNAKWESANTREQKQAILQLLLEEYCHKGHYKGIKWVLKKGKENRLQLALQKPLELAIRGGFGDIVSELCLLMTGEKEASVVALCVQMGYPPLLSILKKHGFPVSADHERQMEELAFTQKSLAPFIAFPQAPNAIAHGAHGGDANKDVREQEYREMVGYVYHSLRNGVSIRILIEICYTEDVAWPYSATSKNSTITARQQIDPWERVLTVPTKPLAIESRKNIPNCLSKSPYASMARRFL